MNNDETWQIQLPHATFAIIIDGKTSRVRDTAPIAKWCKGWSKKTILQYYKDKGAKVEMISCQ